MNFVNGSVFRTVFSVLFLGIFLSTGCSPKPRPPESILDTPEHHVSSGLKLLNKNYLLDAQREFELALQLDPNYTDAHRGLGLTYAKEKKFEPALESMRRARDTSKTQNEKALAYVGFMQLYTMQQGDRWLERVKGMFKDALHYQKDLPEAYFYMGIAYEKANQPWDAKKAFQKVLEINKGLVVEAQNELSSLPN